METKDPALTKTRIVDGDVTDTSSSHINSHPNINNSTMHEIDIADQAHQKGTQTLQETVIGTRYVSDDIAHGEHTHEDIYHNSYNVMSTDDDIETHTTTNKGTDTFQETVIDKKSIVYSEHVKDGDNLARQPDRRDQEGSAFDEGINEHSVGSEAPKSHEITDMNRYANIDNAQTRILNPDEKD